MMEEGLESSALEDNLDIGLGFGDDSQKAEKMNQSFLLLKKKLFRSHDLIQQYSNKIKECERLRSELESCQRESERFKQQHLTATAKTVKLTMENTKLQEANKRLEKLVTEQETQMAGDQRLVQQLSCKVEDIEDRHSERVMQIELEKSVLQAKVKELEQEIKKVSRVHERKSPKKINKKLAKACPFKSRSTASLGMIEDDDLPPDPPKSPEIPEVPQEIPENIPEDSPELPQLNPPDEIDKIVQKSVEECPLDEDDKIIKESKVIEVNKDDESPKKSMREIPVHENAKIPKKSVREIGVNVDISISPPKPVTMDKNIMTDEFYSIKDNPYPLFCERCEQLLEESPDDVICKATRLPPNIPELPPPPVRPVRTRQSPERGESHHPVILDSLQRRVKLLEKRLKRQKRAEISQQSSCCNHSQSLAHCSHNNSFNQPSQFNMMTEVFARMMQLPGFQGMKSRRESQRKSFSMRMKKSQGRAKKMDLSSDTWDVESDEERGGRDERGSFPRPRPPSSRNSSRNAGQDCDRDPEDDFFNSMSSDRIARRRRETLRKIADEPGASPQRSSSEILEPEGNFNSMSSDRSGRRRESAKGITNPSRASSPRKRQETPASSQRNDRRRNQTKTVIEESRVDPRERSPSPEPEVNLFNENNSVPSTPQKRRRLESSSSSVPEETIPKRRKRGDDPPKPVNVRSNLLKNLKRLKKNKAAVKTIPSILSRDERGAETVTPADVLGKKKRIAHVPKQSELPFPLKIMEDDRWEPAETSTSVNSGEKRMTRSLRKSADDKNKKDVEEPVNNISNNPGASTPRPQEEVVQTIESAVEKNLEIIEESDLVIDEAPASPGEEPPASPTGDPPEIPSETIKIASIYETAAVSDGSDSEPPQDPSNCIRELRNRQIHVSPVKQKPSLSKESVEPPDSPVPSPSIPPSPAAPPEPSGPQDPQGPEKVEDLLDNWLLATKKRRGRKPRAFEVSKILQSKAETLIKQELKRLVESPGWEDALHTSVSAKILNSKSPRTVAKATIDFVIDRSEIDEPLDLTYTPPAPPMTKSLQRIVTLLKDLDPKIPELINFVFRGIEYILFRLSSTPSWEAVGELSKLYTVLARIRKDRERVRIMCCDAIYGLQKKSVIVLHAVLTCWPEVLPLFDAEKDQHLPVSIAHIIRSHPVNDSSKCEQVKKLIKGFFKYPQNDPSEVLGGKLLEALGRNYDKSVETGILLLSKREGPEWAYKNIIQRGLMKMIVEGKCSEVYHPLKLLGFLLRPFPLADKDGPVKKIMEQLKALAESDTGSPDLQEGAISALMSLSRHRFDDIAASVLSWQPTRALPELLHEQMNAFFASRGPHWSQIRAKSRKHAGGL
ncbi:uncharacterized protein LOC107047904 [Diachasma alloeum]|uniref:uncharacterized protein LOC107047904 n=1 Tax=Diachasma alloeum TaxID=454923 RepID=UPI0007384695|nr:uncharacterized protein LOC107047904 [Diachasma alloeum]